jgi:hypothetical protein
VNWPWEQIVNAKGRGAEGDPSEGGQFESLCRFEGGIGGTAEGKGGVQTCQRSARGKPAWSMDEVQRLWTQDLLC